jgi:hypothetical protein
MVDVFYGFNMAWTVSIPTSLLILFYVYYFNSKVFAWHIHFTLMFIGLSIVVYSSTLLKLPLFLIKISDEIIFVVFLFSLIVLRPTFEKLALAVMPKRIPMTNNFDELFGVVKDLIIIILIYSVLFLAMELFVDFKVINIAVLNYLYSGAFISYVIYEQIRVMLIRQELLNEVWWPIVNEHGSIIGNVQSQISLADKEKFTHPIIRIHMIDNGMLFLQKRNDNDPFFGGLWDAAIYDHIRVGETMEECTIRNFANEYGIKDPKYIHLTKYKIESEQENHYAFLFVTCHFCDQMRFKCGTEKTKWWTQKQIEENLQSGIFTENFIVEYDLLKRSGLLDAEQYSCTCRMKQTIYSISNNLNGENALKKSL